MHVLLQFCLFEILKICFLCYECTRKFIWIFVRDFLYFFLFIFCIFFFILLEALFSVKQKNMWWTVWLHSGCSARRKLFRKDTFMLFVTERCKFQSISRIEFEEFCKLSRTKSNTLTEFPWKLSLKWNIAYSYLRLILCWCSYLPHL